MCRYTFLHSVVPWLQPTNAVLNFRDTEEMFNFLFLSPMSVQYTDRISHLLSGSRSPYCLHILCRIKPVRWLLSMYSDLCLQGMNIDSRENSKSRKTDSENNGAHLSYMQLRYVRYFYIRFTLTCPVGF
jgi:hypothetical protein